MPRRPDKPLLGFGPAGWALLPVALTLAAVYLFVRDPRYHLYVLIHQLGGWDAVIWFVTRPLFYHSQGRLFPEFGLISLTYVLLAMHLCPRRFGWWWYVGWTLWALLRPMMEYWLPQYLGLWWAPRAGLSLPTLSVAAFAIFEIAALAIMTHSRLVATGSLVAGLWAFSALLGLNSFRIAQNWHLMLITAAWHAILAGTLLTWSIRGRLRSGAPHLCQTCGYDLRGSPTPTCPECGVVKPSAAAGV